MVDWGSRTRREVHDVVHAQPRSGGVLNPPVEIKTKEKTRRPKALYVIPSDFKPLAGVPASRDECRDGPRPCPYVRCEHHLWMVDGRDRPGRRREGRPPPASIVRAPTATSCEADVSEAVKRGVRITVEAKAAMLGISDRRFRMSVQEVIEKLKRNPEARALLTDLLSQ
jgi:hypothetical protein